jgi:hypothetical protein
MVFGALGVLLTLGGLLLGALLSPFLLLAGVHGIQAGASAFIALVLLLVASLLDLGGGYLMLQRRLTGWWVVAIGLIVGAVNNLLSINVLGLIITLAIAYVHVHVKPRYS